ncbi:MAG: nitrilase-related carbon-nitrogen hydrolase [Anaerolineales bacterium]|jgi:predicted amidohydrolase|nr:nitrilase-related carbon-nitrogen hydrolase [Anaerolineales bacterium]
MNLALAQINTKLGDVNANLEKHLEFAKQAAQAGADLLIFPELSLTGYVLQDIAAEVARPARKTDPVFKPLLDASRSLDLLVGFVEMDPRYRFYIAAAYLSAGEIIHVHRKVHLPTYGIFDERRYFAPGNSLRAFETRFGRVGALICEDFWHVSSPYLLWLDGADLFYLTSASPGRGVTDEVLGSAQWVQDINRAYSGLFTSFFAHANRVGFEDGLNFSGGSTVYDPDGHQVVRAAYNDESLTLAEINLAQLRRTRTRLPLLRDERPEMVVSELNRILSREQQSQIS